MANMRRRRLSAGEVSEMRRLFDAGHRITDLSRHYDVHVAIAQRICRRVTYADVPDDLDVIVRGGEPVEAR